MAGNQTLKSPAMLHAQRKFVATTFRTSDWKFDFGDRESATGETSGLGGVACRGAVVE
jgi:hypothetical protein